MELINQLYINVNKILWKLSQTIAITHDCPPQVKTNKANVRWEFTSKNAPNVKYERSLVEILYILLYLNS
jgi:hypothetical protein